MGELRQKVMGELPEEAEDVAKDFIDEVEGKFNEIRDLLAKISVESLDNISDAYDIAHEMSDKLY